MSANRGFLGNGHFKAANKWLGERYGPEGEVDWCSVANPNPPSTAPPAASTPTAARSEPPSSPAPVTTDIEDADQQEEELEFA